MSAGKPESYDEAPQEIRDGVEQLIRTYGSDPALLAGAIVSATTTAILAAKAEEREKAAAYHDDLVVEHTAFSETSKGEASKHHATMARRHAHYAASIRKRGGE